MRRPPWRIQAFCLPLAHLFVVAAQRSGRRARACRSCSYCVLGFPARQVLDRWVKEVQHAVSVPASFAGPFSDGMLFGAESQVPLRHCSSSSTIDKRRILQQASLTAPSTTWP